MNIEQITNWFENKNAFYDTRFPTALINDENRLLEENIQLKVKEYEAIRVNIEENHDRIQMLEEHKRIIEDEFRIIQRLLIARQTEETIEHSYDNIDKNEIERIERIIITIDSDLKRCTKQKNTYQIEIDQIKVQIEKINNEISIDKDTLEKFLDFIRQRDDETFCLMKYTRQDDVRIKELIVEIERYSTKLIDLKRANEQGLIEYTSLENELNRVAETFRRSHKQRQQLIQQWENILVQMQRKDYDIEQFATKLIEIKTKNRNKRQELNEQKLFYERERNNNIFIEKLIDLTNRKTQKLQEQQRIQIDKHTHLETDIISLKITLKSVQNQFQREHVFINQLKHHIFKKEEELNRLKENQECILNRKRFMLDEKYTLDEKLLKLEKSFENEQKYLNNLENKYKMDSKIIYRLNNELLSLRKREKQYEIDHQSYSNQINNMKNQINKLDQQLLKQQESIYHLDFQKQTIDRRLNRLKSEKPNEKYSESDNKIRQLKSEYQNKKSHYEQLENQIKVLQDELRLSQRDFKRLIQEKNEFNEKFLQFDQYTTSSEKSIKRLMNEKEDYLVEQNLLFIELKRLKNILNNSNEVNLNLEHKRIEMQKVMKQRRLEIQANVQLYRIKFNDEKTKRTMLSSELAMLVTKIDKLKGRYQSFAINAHKNDEDNITIQVQYIIKSAQKREELLQQGDQLESLIQKAENELRALENTVQILKQNNSDVKRNFDKLNTSHPEIIEMDELEEHLRTLTEQVRIRQRLFQDIVKQNHSKSHTNLNQIEHDLNELDSIATSKHRIQMKLEDDIEQYRLKAERADQSIKRSLQIINEQKHMNDIEQMRFDIDLRLQHETNRKLYQHILSLCSTINDEKVVDLIEQLKRNQDTKMRTNLQSLSTQSKRQGNKNNEQHSSSVISKSIFFPNIVNVSIDNISLSRQSSIHTKKTI